MSKRGIKWLVLSVLVLIVGIAIYVFIRENTVPLYSCTVCLDKQCASSTIKHETEYGAAREAKGDLCAGMPRDAMFDCWKRPEKDFVSKCPPPKSEFYINWFAGLTR